jgi:hypothetical protein
MQVTVTHEEAHVLSDLLNAYLPELHDEAYRTESFELREQLLHRETVLKALLTRLGALLGQPRPC